MGLEDDNRTGFRNWYDEQHTQALAGAGVREESRSSIGSRPRGGAAATAAAYDILGGLKVEI